MAMYVGMSWCVISMADQDGIILLPMGTTSLVQTFAESDGLVGPKGSCKSFISRVVGYCSKAPPPSTSSTTLLAMPPTVHGQSCGQSFAYSAIPYQWVGLLYAVAGYEVIYRYDGSGQVKEDRKAQVAPASVSSLCFD